MVLWIVLAMNEKVEIIKYAIYPLKFIDLVSLVTDSDYKTIK
jgi:hypothetical protein